jgi:DNA-binding NarL/FixJ family response regulator
VGEAPDGEIALSMIMDERPDVVITDIRMPFMDGLELCRALGSSMPWVRVIILSGYSDFDYAKQAIKLGFCDGMMTRKNADPDEEPEKELEDPEEEPDEEKKPTDSSAHMFAAAAYIRTVTNKLSKLAEPKAPAEEPEVTENLTSAAALMQRLQNLKNQF